jgi:hypothetical protein
MNHLHCYSVSSHREFSFGDVDGRVRLGLQQKFRRHLPTLQHDRCRHEQQIVYSQETGMCDRARLGNQLNLEVVGNYLAHSQGECQCLDR